jgi:hypothetical protein
MDFRAELAKWGYNKGNSIDVEILINEILPSLFSQPEGSYSEEEVEDLIYKVCGTVARLQGITLDGNHIVTAYNKFKKK